MYKGYKVVSLSAPVNGAKSKYKDVSVWAATQLKTAAGVNVTDVSYDASITNGNVTLEFPEPYTIPENGAYLGFSVTVRSLDISEGTDTLSVSDIPPIQRPMPSSQEVSAATRIMALRHIQAYFL